MQYFFKAATVAVAMMSMVVPVMAKTNIKTSDHIKPLVTIHYIAPHPDDCFLGVKVDKVLKVHGTCPTFFVTGSLDAASRASISLNNMSGAGNVHILLRDVNHVDANVWGDLLYSTDNVKFYGHNRHFVFKNNQLTLYIKTVPGKHNYAPSAPADQNTAHTVKAADTH